MTTTKRETKYTVGYYPEIFMRRPYVLDSFDNQVDALEAAARYSRMYYGECSPIIVQHGRKTVHTIPRNAGRAKATP